MSDPISKFSVSICQNMRDVESMISDIYDAGTVAFDTETRSKDFARWPDGALRKMDMECDLASFATPNFRAWVVPIGMVTIPTVDNDEFFAAIKPLMEDTGVLKKAWNFNFDASLFANNDVWVACYEDVMVKAHLLDENKGAGLKTRCADGGMELHKFNFKAYWKMRHLFLTKARDKKDQPLVKESDLTPLETEYTTYSADDSIATIVLDPIYDEQLEKEPKLKEMYHRLLNPTVRTLFNMERRGIPLDRTYIRVVSKTCAEDLADAEREVFRAAGQHFNMGSPKDLSRVLYQELGMPVFKTTAKEANSTDAGTLEKLAEAGYKVAEHILHWRHKNKLYTGYLDPNGGLTEACYDHGCLHPSYNICGTGTGRLSCSNPNAQQVPRSSKKTYNIRRAFIPHKGYRLVGGDQSQVELRMMAHFSGDVAMVNEYLKDEAFWRALNEGLSTKGLHKSDIHQQTADACRCDRSPTAKAINFGLLYGMQSKKLGLTLTSVAFKRCLEDGIPFDPIRDIVTYELADEFRTNFFNLHPGITAYQEYIGEKALRQGYIETRYGRKRRLPDLYSGDRYLILGAQRQAVNTTIQGHVGEMMLLSMSKAENVIPNPDGVALAKLGFRMFLQVHDEVIGECPDNDQTVQDVQHHLTRIFQNPAPCTDAYPYSGYRVPIIFEPKSGYSWAEIH